MTTGEALEAIVKRVISTHAGYYNWDEKVLTLDFQIDITPDEAVALHPLGPGDGWWAWINGKGWSS